MVTLVLNDYPNHWTTKKLKYLFNYTLSSVDRHVHLEELPVDICHYPDVYHNEKIRPSDPLPKGTCTEDEFLKFSLRDGDILITKDSESPDDIGVPCLIRGNLPNTVCGYHLGIIRPKTRVDSGYFFRFLQTDLVKWYFYGESSGITRYGLGKPSVENLELPVPPLEEQQLISRYLDKKTEQIDSLIEKIQKKIELLKEQRTSLINHCVTKGLDPNVEMKDSGIEWIGEIPSHWGITKIRFVSSLKEQKNDDGISRGMLSVSQYLGIIPKVYEDESLELTSEESSRYWVVDDNDLVVNTMWLQFCGLGVSFGVTGYVSPDYKVYRLDLEQVVPRFIHHLLRSNRYVDLYSRHLRGIRPNSSRVGTHDFQRFCIPLPPVDEQIEISNYIEKKITYSDVLIEKETHRIELLKEYRQSLISSVVTGKVRVTEDMT